MEQVISQNGKPFYRNNNVRQLTNEQKVEIAIQKELRPTPTSTNVNIAAQFGVSKDLVNRISAESLNPDQKLIYEQRIKALKVDAIDVVYLGLQKSKELIKKADSPNHLAGVTASVGKAHEIYRIETNQSTQNIAIVDCAAIARQAFEIKAKLAQADQDQAPLTQAEKIAIYEEICLAQGQQPDVSLLELDSDQDGNLDHNQDKP